MSGVLIGIAAFPTRGNLDNDARAEYRS